VLFMRIGYNNSFRIVWSHGSEGKSLQLQSLVLFVSLQHEIHVSSLFLISNKQHGKNVCYLFGSLFACSQPWLSVVIVGTLLQCILDSSFCLDSEEKEA
jgi:hypothetical protein